MTKTHEDYEKERDERIANDKAAFDGLTDDQQKAIKETYAALDNAMDTLRDCQDLWLSDVKKLDHAFWKLRNNFLLGVGETYE
jgi:hypothetical protein